MEIYPSLERLYRTCWFFFKTGNCNPTLLSRFTVGHLLRRTADKRLKYHLPGYAVIELLTDIQPRDCYFHDRPAPYLLSIQMGGHIMTLKWRQLKSLRLVSNIVRLLSHSISFFFTLLSDMRNRCKKLSSTDG